MMNRPKYAALFLAAGLWGLLIALSAGTAQAHGVFIFAWPEGDRICTDSYFAKKSKVRDGQVKMLTPDGQELQRGRTDNQGGFCFLRPDKPGDLLFVIEAGQGHRGEFRLRAEDWAGAGGPAPASTPSAQGVSAPEAAAVGAALQSESLGLDQDALRLIVREELETQIGPLRRALAEAAEPEPGLKEIVGGLGWLAGLAGLGLWLSARRRR